MLKTFDPAEVSIVFGPYLMRGFSEEQVTITFDEDDWTQETGCDGETVRVKSNNQSATIVITLQQSSPSNDELSFTRNQDRLTNSGVYPLTIKDNLGTTKYTGNAYVQKMADGAFGKTANARQWTLRTDFLIANLGGNQNGVIDNI
jgi:hypothetical protein